MLGSVIASAVKSSLGSFLQSAAIKFIFFTLMLVFVSAVVNFMTSKLLSGYNASSLQSALAGIPASVWYILEICAFPFGLKVVLSAYVTRFTIRRIPFMG